jgi:DNA polymerase-3 subunit epsilon
MTWTAATLHIIDFEGSRQSGVVEFGVVTVVGTKIISTYTRLCAPIGPVSPTEASTHGIHEADTAGTPPFEAEAAWFAQQRQTGPFCAHHAPVERGLLRHTWAVPPAAPDFLAPDPANAPRVAEWGPWLDTRQLYERLYPGQPNYQLMELIAAFSLKGELSALAATYCPSNRRRPHCALFDALAAALLLIRLAHEPALAAASLAWLLRHSAPPTDAQAQNQTALGLED